MFAYIIYQIHLYLYLITCPLYFNGRFSPPYHPSETVPSDSMIWSIVVLYPPNMPLFIPCPHPNKHSFKARLPPQRKNPLSTNTCRNTPNRRKSLCYMAAIIATIPPDKNVHNYSVSESAMCLFMQAVCSNGHCCKIFMGAMSSLLHGLLPIFYCIDRRFHISSDERMICYFHNPIYLCAA